MSARSPQDDSPSAEKLPQGRQSSRLAFRSVHASDHATADLAIVRGALLRVETLGTSAAAVCGVLCGAVCATVT